ncbi:hypothetical protein Dcar01_02827 [Deinococcus carri]|uniref:Glycosyltransferase 2-like domain-containing protein n=1 Tax=Deinococcus carri TaxID=1211323 RepID=A0ABP9WAB1_9DEIO
MLESNKTATVIVNWNGYADTIGCLYSLCKSGVDINDIIVVDNNSTNNSIKEIREHFPRVNIIESDINGGFSYGCNLGIKYALIHNYSFVWLLNNDTLVLPDTLSKMVSYANDTGAKIVGCTVRDIAFPYNLQLLGGGFVNFFNGTTQLNLKEDAAGMTFISGASMLVRSEIFSDIGLFDEGYTMYWEDVEFCVRAKRHGHSLGAAFDALVLHKEGGSVGRRSLLKARYITLSTRRFFRQTTKLWLLPVMYQQLGRSIMSIKRGEYEYLQVIWL